MGGTAIRAPSDDLKNHTTVLTQLKEIAETGLGIRGNPASAYVKISDLVAAGLVNYISGVISPAAKIATGGGLTTVSVLNSIVGNGTAGTPIQLSGDAATPGNTMLYGTNGSGTKGWYAQPAGGGVSSVVYTMPKDVPPITPTVWDDEFNSGTSIDTAGSRFAGANPWLPFLNTGTATTVVSQGVLQSFNAPGAGGAGAGYMQAVPAGNWTFEWKGTRPIFEIVNTANWHGYYFGSGGGTSFLIQSETRNWSTGAYTFNASVISWNTLGLPFYFKVQFDGTNLIFSYSLTGYNSDYVALTTVAVASWIGTPTHLGTGLHANGCVDWFRRTA